MRGFGPRSDHNVILMSRSIGRNKVCLLCLERKVDSVLGSLQASELHIYCLYVHVCTYSCIYVHACIHRISGGANIIHTTCNAHTCMNLCVLSIQLCTNISGGDVLGECKLRVCVCVRVLH